MRACRQLGGPSLAPPRQHALTAGHGSNSRPAGVSTAAARRLHRRRQPARVAAAATSDFAELRAAASEAVSSAQSKLPALEQAKRSAEQHREPAAEAERQWQELHGRLTALQAEAASAMKELRSGVVATAGSEPVATMAVLRSHVAERLQHFQESHGLAGAQEWRVFRPTDLPLHSIPGGRMAYQVAAVDDDGQRYAVVAVAISNPFLVENLRSLIMHWGVAEGPGSGWTQPPKGWHSSPGVSTPAGDRAWETVFGAFAPVVQGEPLVDATVYSVVLQIPLEGMLELRGGVKCVLRRTDHGQPEWIKAGPHNNGDFFLDFSPAIQMFERRRRAVQAAAIAQAREAARLAALEKAAAAAKAKGDRAATKELAAAVKEWANLLESDEWDDSAGEEPPEEEPVPVLVSSIDDEEPVGPEPPRWIQQIESYTQLSDLPSERTTSDHVRTLHRLATAVAEARHDGATEARDLLSRCLEVERLLQQVDLLELNTRAAQQEKEQLQAMYKSAMDESAHLMNELTHAAEAARRTAVKLRGRETEVTQRDLEAVAQQAAEELLKKSSGGGFWPFKEEERQLVFVQQKVMEVAGMDATVVVQVFVEGTKAAVEAATSPKKAAADSEGEEDEEAAEEVAAADSAAAAAADGKPAAAAGGKKEAKEAAKEKKGGKEKEGAKGKKRKEKKAPGFEHVVLGVAVGEAFPDNHIKTPIIMHMGCVAHQYAKWRPPPLKWSCTPAAVSEEGASASQVPFQRYRIAAEGGASVFVDPTLFALALRMPLKDCLAESVRGVEFVLKTGDGEWLSWQHGHSQVSNFYAELPVPLR
ncbi:hypothetical protein ABPG75_009489 [Micractinium tetrahymenae]